MSEQCLYLVWLGCMGAIPLPQHLRDKTPQPKVHDTWNAETVSTLASPPQHGQHTHHYANRICNHSMEYYSAMKKVSQSLMQATAWTGLTHILSRKIHQAQKDKYCISAVTHGTQNWQISEMQKVEQSVWGAVGRQAVSCCLQGELLFTKFRVVRGERWKSFIQVVGCTIL